MSLPQTGFSQSGVTILGRRSPRWAFWDRLVLQKGDVVYLRRLRIIGTPLFNIFLHHIESPDPDRFPHDHPWWFLSLVLRGGYREVVWKWRTSLMQHNSTNYDGHRYWKRWSLHAMDQQSAHKITKVQPGTITLIVTGPRRRTWGFWTDNGWVAWDHYEDTLTLTES